MAVEFHCLLSNRLNGLDMNATVQQEGWYHKRNPKLFLKPNFMHNTSQVEQCSWKTLLVYFPCSDHVVDDKPQISIGHISET